MKTGKGYAKKQERRNRPIGSKNSANMTAVDKPTWLLKIKFVANLRLSLQSLT